MAMMDAPENKDQMAEIAKTGGDIVEPTRINREADIGQASNNFATSWRFRNLAMEAENAFKHFAIFETIPKEPSLEVEKVHPMRPAIILGSGASVDPILPMLKKWKHGLFCSTSHLSTLAYHGVYPTMFACPDPKGLMSEFSMPADSLARMFEKTVMACTPIQPYQYTQVWRGKRRWYLIFDPTQDWYSLILRPVFKWIDNILLPFSANAPALLAIAQHMGYAPIYMLGCDFAGNRFTAQQWVDDKWVEDKGSPVPEGHEVKTYNGLPSTPNLMWAWRGMLCVARLNAEKANDKAWHVYNCGGDLSALKDSFPYCNPSWLIRSQGRGEIMSWTKQKYVYELDLALCRFNTFIFRVHNGIDEGTRVQLCNSYEELNDQLVALNNGLESSRAFANSLTPEARKQVLEQTRFNADLIKGVDIPAYLQYAHELKEEILRRDGKLPPVTAER